jgi:type IV pilus assembly protein PilV
MRQPLLRNPQQGVMLIEALIAILIFSIGILAVVGMQGMAIKTVTESRSRSEAAFFASQLLSQMWIDQNISPAGANTSNITVGNYDYQGGASVPPRVSDWVGQVTTRLPGANQAGVRPKITITNATASGATVKIELFWQLPEEASLVPPPPPHTYVVITAIQV